MNPLLSIIAFLISALIAATFASKTTKPMSKSSFEGDLGDVDPSTISALRRLGDLANDYDHESLTGDPYEALTGALSLDNGDNRSNFLLGDIDDIEDGLYNDDYPVEGALFSKMKARRTEKKAKKSGFTPNLLAKQAVTNILKRETDVNKATQAVNQINAISATPGALLATKKISKVQVTGGRMKLTETDLFINGQIFANAIILWQQYYPGLSRSQTLIADGNDLEFEFVEPAVGDVTQVQVIMIHLMANDLNKIKNVEMTLAISGLGIDGSSLASTRDRVELFTNEFGKTTIVYFPTKKLKEELFAAPFASPTTANPIQVTLGGVPTGVAATTRLCGIDDEDWKAYKAMVGLV